MRPERLKQRSLSAVMYSYLRLCIEIHEYEKGISHHFVISLLLHHYVSSDIGYHVYKKQNQVPSTNVKINVKNIVVKMKGTKHSTWAFFDFILP